MDRPESYPALGENSGRLGRGLRLLGNARATWQLVRILVIVQLIPFAWDMIVPGAGKLSLAHGHLGLTETRFLSGSYWQPFTHAFIHANWLHLLANVTCILLLGPKVEHIVTKRTFWLLTLFSAIAGGALFMLFTPATPLSATDPQRTLVGSSAVCFGFLVLLTTLSPDSKFLPLFLSGRSIGVAIILANLCLALLNPDLRIGILAGWGEHLLECGLNGLFQVSHACHLGGSLVGFFYGKYLLRPRVTLDSLKRAREKREPEVKPRG
jgi:membrane associated rhomboid family serine protease